MVNYKDSRDADITNFKIITSHALGGNEDDHSNLLVLGCSHVPAVIAENRMLYYGPCCNLYIIYQKHETAELRLIISHQSGFI